MSFIRLGYSGYVLSLFQLYSLYILRLFWLYPKPIYYIFWAFLSYVLKPYARLIFSLFFMQLSCNFFFLPSLVYSYIIKSASSSPTLSYKYVFFFSFNRDGKDIILVIQSSREDSSFLARGLGLISSITLYLSGLYLFPLFFLVQAIYVYLNSYPQDVCRDQSLKSSIQYFFCIGIYGIVLPINLSNFRDLFLLICFS